jgi:hypothetical protein
MWNYRLIDSGKSRKCVIKSSSDWDKIHASDSFVPKYKDEKALNDLNTEIFI